MIDTTKIGQVAAEIMEALPQEEAGGNIIAVGIVVVVDCGEAETYTRVKTTTDFFYEQLGLFHAAIHVVESGVDPND